MTHETAPLIPIAGIPMPPNLSRLLAYHGDARRVAVYWDGFDLMLDDGHMLTNMGDWVVWGCYTRHPRIARYLEPFNIRSRGEFGPSPDGLLIDNQEQRLFAGPVASLRRELEKNETPTLESALLENALERGREPIRLSLGDMLLQPGPAYLDPRDRVATLELFLDSLSAQGGTP